MAVTATADDKVVKHCITALGMKRPYICRLSSNRPNLNYQVRRKDVSTLDSIADYITNTPGFGVIYCLSRKDCENLASHLNDKLFQKGEMATTVSYYHADMSEGERKNSN
jgi:ATP-dependent DNA helicase RecQ